MKEVHTFMGNVANTLDLSVYGHTNAKRQIERIIGQWINGDITGYCFGFEGPPGVGKTSLAKKGIAQCLLDEHGVARPFAFIAMGGSTNSSTLDGHNYTYVGSTWGRIVDILMDTKIMNPIIFIDELDKVSKTENGKEIIGILTHLIDQTQNDTFQDKYFNGINLNLSKALFIFSYNDADLIDRILLDRIHRIKFETISVEDKLIIVRNFILPEIYKKMGLENMISISDNVIETIINDYTAEPGVRKLKELLFEIIGEINLNILKNTIALDIPLVITVEDIKTNYLKEHVEVRPMKIHAAPRVGVINGMWANAAGKGGILPIEAAYYPASAFLELKLTGMQGDVMKESMTVAKSLAWALFVQSEANALEKIEKTQGLHVHVPEGATPKDGPSAGTAITMVLYSLFSGRQIKNDVAITGEICLQGRVTAIGGLELKILGGLRAGIKTFIYPQENEKDFEKFMKKYATKPALVGKQFFAVETIEEVIPLIF
jgi:ATP-dependent Lon protease